MAKSYEPEDVKAMFERADADSWRDLIAWLEGSGRTFNFSPGEPGELRRDLEELADSGRPFPRDWRVAYELLQDV